MEGYSQPPPERWGLERWKHTPPSQHGLAQERDGHWENGRELALTNQLIALLKCAKIHGYPNRCENCYSENYNYLLSTRDTQVIDIITQFAYVFTLLFQYFDYTHFPELSLLPPHWKIHHSHGNDGWNNAYSSWLPGRNEDYQAEPALSSLSSESLPDLWLPKLPGSLVWTQGTSAVRAQLQRNASRIATVFRWDGFLIRFWKN